MEEPACQKHEERYGKADDAEPIPIGLSIEIVLPSVETRSRIGDWEADTVIARTTAKRL